MSKSKILLAVIAFGLAGCTSLGGEGLGWSDYSYVPAARRVSVGDGTLTVAAPRPWNRRRAILFDDVRAVEDWTLNGETLDGMTFISGLKNGKTLVRQRRSADQQVPMFRSNMTPPEIAAMLESLYRVRGGTVDFHTLSLQPRPFLGT